MLKIKRVYERYDENDGYRILVDRLWPRGISKIDSHIDLWLKDIAPSSELRRWFNHDPMKWKDFQKKYNSELNGNLEMVERIRVLLKQHRNVTFVYAARDELHNNAVVLLDYFLH